MFQSINLVQIYSRVYDKITLLMVHQSTALNLTVDIKSTYTYNTLFFYSLFAELSDGAQVSYSKWQWDMNALFIVKEEDAVTETSGCIKNLCVSVGFYGIFFYSVCCVFKRKHLLYFSFISPHFHAAISMHKFTMRVKTGGWKHA